MTDTLNPLALNDLLCDASGIKATDMAEVSQNIKDTLIREALYGIAKGCEILCRNPDFDLFRNIIYEQQRELAMKMDKKLAGGEEN